MEAVIRVRSRDGLERVSVSPRGTVAELQLKIERDLQVPVASQHLSTNQSILLAKDANGAASVANIKDPSAQLVALGISHGSIVFLFYTGDRVVSGPKITPSGTFGKKMTMDDLIAMQTRIELQKTPHCNALSCDQDAAQAFHHYVHENLAFAVKRGGFMYGTVSDAGDVHVNFIYEPPQQGSEDSLLLMRSPEEEKRVEVIAAGLGMIRVGFIFTQSVTQGKKGYTLSGTEIRQAAELQSESQLQSWSIVVVKLDESAEVHFEAYQLSEQCLKLFKEGLFVEDCTGLDPKLSRMKKDVVVLGKDTRDVDNDLFLVPTKIISHKGSLKCEFPIENRVIAPSFQALKSHLEKHKSEPYNDRIADFHLILYLTNFLDFSTDVPRLTEAIANKTPVPDGYQLLIDSLANNE